MGGLRAHAWLAVGRSWKSRGRAAEIVPSLDACIRDESVATFLSLRIQAEENKEPYALLNVLLSGGGS